MSKQTISVYSDASLGQVSGHTSNRGGVGIAVYVNSELVHAIVHPVFGNIPSIIQLEKLAHRLARNFARNYFMGEITYYTDCLQLVDTNTIPDLEWVSRNSPAMKFCDFLATIASIATSRTATHYMSSQSLSILQETFEAMR